MLSEFDVLEIVKRDRKVINPDIIRSPITLQYGWAASLLSVFIKDYLFYVMCFFLWMINFFWIGLWPIVLNVDVM